jgi:methionine-rich copper-binding protein CopC
VHLHESVPVDHSTLTVLPKDIVLEFTKPIQLTALSLQKSDGKTQDLAPLPKVADSRVSVPMPQNLTAGAYLINWRGVGADGHVMSGKISFSVASK